MLWLPDLAPWDIGGDGSPTSTEASSLCVDLPEVWMLMLWLSDLPPCDIGGDGSATSPEASSLRVDLPEAWGRPTGAPRAATLSSLSAMMLLA